MLSINIEKEILKTKLRMIVTSYRGGGEGKDMECGSTYVDGMVLWTVLVLVWEVDLRMLVLLLLVIICMSSTTYVFFCIMKYYIKKIIKEKIDV